MNQGLVGYFFRLQEWGHYLPRWFCYYDDMIKLCPRFYHLHPMCWTQEPIPTSKGMEKSSSMIRSMIRLKNVNSVLEMLENDTNGYKS